MISSIVANDKAYAIAVDIIGDRLTTNMTSVGTHVDEGMTNFLGVDHGHIKDVISESGLGNNVRAIVFSWCLAHTLTFWYRYYMIDLQNILGNL